MPKLFVLIKRKGTKRFTGAIPTKKGTTKAKLMKQLRRKLKGGFSFKIVSEVQLKRVIIKQRPRLRPRKVKKRRRKVRRRRRKRKR